VVDKSTCDDIEVTDALGTYRKQGLNEIRTYSQEFQALTSTEL
jgi:hypothetical protein